MQAPFKEYPDLRVKNIQALRDSLKRGSIVIVFKTPTHQNKSYLSTKIY